MSPQFEFQSAPAHNDEAAVRIIIMADMGTNEAAFDASTNGGHPVGDNIMTIAVANAVTEQIRFNARPAGHGPTPWFAGRPSLVVHPGTTTFPVVLLTQVL